MKNVAYDKEYRQYHQKQEAVFCPDYFQHTETVILSPQYKVTERFFCGEVEGCTLQATENILLDDSGKELYQWRNIDNDSEFYKIIEHGDGCSYLIFRIDLYGYSVLNLSAMKDFHYIPSGSFPEGETFIWIDVFYNQINNMLAVLGCYWACPLGVMLLDFSHPMEEPCFLADISEHIGAQYDSDANVDFLEWHNTDLILSAVHHQTGTKETICLSEAEYRKWLA